MTQKLMLSAMLMVFLTVQSVFAIDNFTLTDTDGVQHDLYSYLQEDEVVVLKFFFLDCHNCQAFAPHLDGVYDEFGSNEGNVKVLTLEVLGAEDSMIDAWRQEHNTIVPAMGGNGAYTFWNNNIKPVLGSAFTQVVVLKANAANPAASEMKYAEFGWVGTSQTAEITNVISDNGGLSATGLTEVSAQEDMFILGPVPSFDVVTLSNRNLTSGYWTVQIYNIAGILVKESEIEINTRDEKFEFDLSNLTQGNYFFSIANGKDRWVKEISKTN